MDDRDKIAFLQELATTHFNDGNLSAAVAAWQQVLDVDATNEEARKGVALAQRRQAAATQAGSESGPFGQDLAPPDTDATMAFAPGQLTPPFDGERTMMVPGPGQAAGPFGGEAEDIESTIVFTPEAAAAVAKPAAGGFDSARTMAFQAPPIPASAPPGFDANRTMAFQPPPIAASPPPGFDANRTMNFQPPPATPPGFDANRTMVFQPPPLTPGPDANQTMVFGAPPPAPPPAAPPWGSIPISDDSDRTVLAAEPAGGGDFEMAGSDATIMSPAEGSPSTFDLPAAPPPAPLPPARGLTPPPMGRDAGKELEDFELPSGGLEMAGTRPEPDRFARPPLGSAPPPAPPPAAAKDAGFSFELPPPPPATSGQFALPELPSLGLPPPPTSFSAPPPAPPPRAPARSSAFGDVDPGEIADLSAPVVAHRAAEPSEEEAPLDEAAAAAREEKLKAEYAKQFGKTPVVSAPLPMPSARVAGRKGNWKALTIMLAVFGAAVAGGWFALKEFKKPPPAPSTTIARKVVKTPEQLRAEYLTAVASADASLTAGNFDDTVKKVAAAGEAAERAALTMTPELDKVRDSLQFEQAWQSKYEKALRYFCTEDYGSARLLLQELEQAKPSDARPGQYIEKLWYNAGVQQLQVKQPWEAPFYFEQVIARNAGDKEAQQLRQFAMGFDPGDPLDAEYSFRVDSLVYRTEGCK